MNKAFAIITCLLFLASCESFSGLLDDNKNSIKDDDSRISVLGGQDGVDVDESLKNVPILIPGKQKNDKWYSSGGQNIFTAENPELDSAFSKRVITKIGDGGDKTGHLSATPIVADGKIFTIDAEGVVSAFNADNIKDDLWEYEIKTDSEQGSFLNAGISYFEGKIYIATGYNLILALNAESGELVWERKINSMARSAPASNGEIVVVNTLDNRAYALSAKNGGILWIHSGFEDEISSLGSASPVLYKGLVFVPYSSGELYALKQEDGEQVWFSNLESSRLASSHYLSDIDATPVIRNDVLYAVSNSGFLGAFNVFNGEKLWDVEISSSKSVWYASNFLYMLDKYNNLLAISAKTGGIKWKSALQSYRKPKRKIGSVYWHGPVLAGDLLWVVNSDARLLAVSPQNGKVVSRHKILRNIFLPPVVANEKMYLLSNDAKLIFMDNSNKDSSTRYFFNADEDVKSRWF